VEFSVSQEPITISPGQKEVITVVYTNTGGVVISSAQARISAVDPFTSSDDTAFLGTMAPGEAKEAFFEIAVDGSATEKEYGLDSEVRFRDALGNSIISDPIKVPILVESPTGISAVLGNPLVLALIAGLVIGGGYLIYRKRKGQ
jgi:hypothetical protein